MQASRYSETDHKGRQASATTAAERREARATTAVRQWQQNNLQHEISSAVYTNSIHRNWALTTGTTWSHRSEQQLR